MSLTAETKQDFQPPKHKTSVDTTSLLESLRDAELAMSLAMKHGLWAEPEALMNRRISISLSLNLDGRVGFDLLQLKSSHLRRLLPSADQIESHHGSPEGQARGTCSSSKFAATAATACHPSPTTSVR